ncbi:hypothetical protein [Ottowia testudinis]|uniref:Uncharacterized protein n=1 Tax=Ottowia testudinis TaxID=2816950 RepID=A0A975CEI2_9BURK|nr:hypothetical protein [Ottowia testudinis]QTD44301.1 hypothetical protein J1M35_14430 [Ottowia testudinis]
MQFNQQVMVHGIKESQGNFEGRAFSSTTFHVEADLKANGAGRSVGRVTTPMKCGDAAEFEKWAHLPATAFPVKCDAIFEMQANGKGGTDLIMASIKPCAPDRGMKAA